MNIELSDVLGLLLASKKLYTTKHHKGRDNRDDLVKQMVRVG
jgi:hypothetical protein